MSKAKVIRIGLPQFRHIEVACPHCGETCWMLDVKASLPPQTGTTKCSRCGAELTYKEEISEDAGE